MTMANLRTTLVGAYIVLGAAIVAAGLTTDRGDALVAAVVVTLGLLFVPTVRVRRVEGDASPSELGILWPSLLVFALGMAVPTLLIVLPPLGVAAFVGFVAAYVVFARAVSRGLAQHSDTLLPAGGDTDFGIFTALTPMSPPPTAAEPPAEDETHTAYDPKGGRDPLKGLTRHDRRESE